MSGERLHVAALEAEKGESVQWFVSHDREGHIVIATIRHRDVRVWDTSVNRAMRIHHLGRGRPPNPALQALVVSFLHLGRALIRFAQRYGVPYDGDA